MRRLLPGGIASAVAAVVFAVALSGTAFAYFTTTGSGLTVVEVSKISPSSISTATPAVGGTVALTWTAVTAPGSGAVTYAVTRNGGQPKGTCAGQLSLTTCTDANLDPGTYSYVVTAKWRSWTAGSAVKTAQVTVGVADHLTLAAASLTPTAGASDNLTIAAKDAGGNTVTTYAEAHNLTFTGASSSPNATAPTVVNSAGAAIAFGSATAINFTAGVATVTSSKNGLMKLYASGKAGIQVTDSSISTEAPLEMTVAATSAAKFVLTALTTTPTSGETDNLTTTALDAYGNTATAYAGSHNLTFSGASASPGGTVPTVSDSAGTAVAFGNATAISFSAGVATVTASKNGAMKLYKSGSTSLKVTDGTLLTPTALVVAVAAATAVKFTLSASATTLTAGGSSNLTTTALDAYGNTATAYAGSHNLTFTGASSSPNATAPTVVNSAGAAIAFGSATAINFTAGVATVTSSKNGLMNLYKAESPSITVSDGSISSVAPVAATVSPTTASKFGFTSVSVSAGTLSSSCIFTCTLTNLGNSGTVKAKVAVADAYGNTVSALGAGHAVKVTTNGSGTISGTPLAIPSAGAAESATTFTYTSKSSGSFTEIITAAASEGTAYASATLTASK